MACAQGVLYRTQMINHMQITTLQIITLINHMQKKAAAAYFPTSQRINCLCKTAKVLRRGYMSYALPHQQQVVVGVIPHRQASPVLMRPLEEQSSKLLTAAMLCIPCFLHYSLTNSFPLLYLSPLCLYECLGFCWWFHILHAFLKVKQLAFP